MSCQLFQEMSMIIKEEMQMVNLSNGGMLWVRA